MRGNINNTINLDLESYLKVMRCEHDNETLGLTVLDEPAALQSDPTILDLQVSFCFLSSLVFCICLFVAFVCCLFACLIVLDKPAALQSDPTILDLQVSFLFLCCICLFIFNCMFVCLLV